MLQITEKQLPLLIMMAFIIFADGLVLTGYRVNVIASPVKANQGDLGTRDILSPNSALVIGVATILGSLVGMRAAVSAWAVDNETK